MTVYESKNHVERELGTIHRSVAVVLAGEETIDVIANNNMHEGRY